MKIDIEFSGFHGEKEYRFTFKDLERDNDEPTKEDYEFAQKVSPVSLEFR